MTLSIEKFANENADSALQPLECNGPEGPVLATPAYAGYAAGLGVAFTLGLWNGQCCYTEADEFAPEDLEEGATADELLRARTDKL